jgi:hypothetical protein
VLPFGQKITLGLLATITLEVKPSAHMHRSSASAIFECNLEFMYREDVQHRLRVCLDHLSCVKMAAFQFKSSIGETEK